MTVVLALVVQLLVVPLSSQGVPTAAAEEAPAPSDRTRVVMAWRTGGPVVKQAAERALLGSDADVRAFLATGMAQAAKVDDRVTVNQMVASGGPAIQSAAQQALGSTQWP